MMMKEIETEMAYVSTTTPSLFARIGAGVEELVNRYRTYRLYRETYYSLSALTDRELMDLGVHRSEIRQVALEAAYS